MAEQPNGQRVGLGERMFLDKSAHAGCQICNPICIINSEAHSGGAGAIVDRVRAALQNAGHGVQIVEVHSGQEISAAAAEAVGKGLGPVLVGGGDGTINAAASALVGTSSALAVLPLGTFNHLAKDLNIPLDVEGAVANAFSGKEIAIDVGEVNGRFFLNNSSIGLYPGLVANRESIEKRGHGKWAAFFPAAAYALWRYSPLTVRLNISGQRDVATTTPFVFVGNNKYETHPPLLGQRKSLTTGLLWFCRAPHASRTRLFIAALKALTGLGSVTELADFDATECEVITGRKHIRVSVDGEVVAMQSPLHYSIKPKALRIIVPA
jgi:diacylglycerol kinase family enzyme